MNREVGRGYIRNGMGITEGGGVGVVMLAAEPRTVLESVSKEGARKIEAKWKESK